MVWLPPIGRYSVDSFFDGRLEFPCLNPVEAR